jgi:hypothetical protein
MKHHTTWGGEFLAGRPGFELAALVARSHHERWDGSGYPHGLAGEDIPEAATIVSVADAFDAMTSDRPYRAARSLSTAVREIVACAPASSSVPESWRRWCGSTGEKCCLSHTGTRSSKWRPSRTLKPPAPEVQVPRRRQTPQSVEN